jgi:hypothetical protein
MVSRMLRSNVIGHTLLGVFPVRDERALGPGTHYVVSLRQRTLCGLAVMIGLLMAHEICTTSSRARHFWSTVLEWIFGVGRCEAMALVIGGDVSAEPSICVEESFVVTAPAL